MNAMQRANMWMWLGVTLLMLAFAVYDGVARGGSKDTFTFVGLAMAAGFMFMVKFSRRNRKE